MPDNVKPFVLNDETVENSYGFFVITAGIKLDRFLNNPVMLSDHRNANLSVLGKWNDLKKEDGKLLGMPEFDEEDEDAAKIKGKVDRGYIKGASMGLLFNRDSMVYLEGKIVLKECELIEGTIIPVPSNPNSLRLYIKEGEPLSEEEIKSLCLSIQTPITENFNTETDMKKIVLSMAALVALGFDDADKDGVEEAVLNAKILDLAKVNKELKADNDKYKGEKTATELKAKSDCFDAAVTVGKVTADKKESFLALDFDQMKNILEGIPEKKTLGAITEVTTDNSEIKTVDDFAALSVEKQLAFKEQKPEEYKKLFN